MKNTTDYNLLDQAWMPVIYHDGTVAKIGIQQAFENAADIRQIAAPNPMDRAAILRFLIALTYWGGSNLENAKWQACINKLKQQRNLFNLLGEGLRFYQDQTARRRRPITDLIQEAPSGHNYVHFCHIEDYDAGLCLPCCIMGLLRLPMFSVSGLPDLKSGINGTPPIYVIPIGESLLDTLQINCPPVENLGIFALDNPLARPEGNSDVPILTGLSALSRRVWLHEPGDTAGACASCGVRSDMLVRSCESESAGTLESKVWTDPHVVSYAEEPEKKVKAPDLTAGYFRMDRPWTALMANFLAHGGPKPLHLFVTGFATNKAKNIDVWENLLELPEALFGADELLIRWENEGKKLPAQLRPWHESNRKHTELGILATAIRPHVEARVAAQATELIAGGEEAWKDAAKNYSPLMKVLAGAISPGVTTKALERRRQISATMPRMEAEPPKPKKGKRK
ncbi:MAG: type I-E CRISPR-associated protein Cse1/CasA [Candidatus Sumerlaeota bacterium]|nr:type I-E CRISPR-associated protein Cse1/CasA [Candidatus Sumerlaeota bacterium]